MPIIIADEHIPANLVRFKLPPAIHARLHALLDQQDQGRPLTEDERGEAEGLVDLADLLTLLRLRTERATRWTNYLFALARFKT